jgi:type I restriction enzyme S subunit
MTVDSTTMKLSDLCDFVAVQVDPRDRANAVYVGLEHLASRSFERIGSGTADEVQSSKYEFQPNDVLYGKLRPYLDKAVLARETGVCTTELLVLRPKQGVDPRFLVSVVHAPTFVEHAVAGTTGAQHPRTSWNHIRDFELPEFGSDEQEKVGNFLWQVHSAIVSSERAIEIGADLKQAAMEELFTRGLRSEAHKETEIGPMPESWELVQFGAVREWLQYGTSIHCTYDRSDFPVLRIPNIEPGRVSINDIKFCTLNNEEAARYRLERGDLIFIRTNGVIERLGTCAVYAGEPEGALFASYLIRARLKRDQLVPHFAAYFFASELGTSIIAGRATPAADGKYNLNTAIIDSLPIPLPPTLDEQQEIVQVLDTIDSKIGLHRKKRAALDDLFKALLHKLITGEIRVSDLDLGALAPPQVAEATA